MSSIKIFCYSQVSFSFFVFSNKKLIRRLNLKGIERIKIGFRYGLSKKRLDFIWPFLYIILNEC
ncbi:MAG: hypothetical protein D6785_12490 [Planctomycetota bacterium]|nr:MAG: hypothetical protein D6785_12490 [Planctomycetota bacterium]